MKSLDIVVVAVVFVVNIFTSVVATAAEVDIVSPAVVMQANFLFLHVTSVTEVRTYSWDPS